LFALRRGTTLVTTSIFYCVTEDIVTMGRTECVKDSLTLKVQPYTLSNSYNHS